MDHDGNQAQGPHEMADHDEAAADRLRRYEGVERSIEQSMEGLATTMANLGYEEAASNALDTAGSAQTEATRAKYGAAAYDDAAKSWKGVEHDLAEQAKLMGEKYAADATASGARQELAGAHGMTEDQRTDLEVLAAREEAASPVYERRATDMGAEAQREMEHARVEEESARLGDPESGLEPR